MYRRRLFPAFLATALLMTETGCWSSKEIEDLSMYTALTMDTGQPSKVEQTFEKEGGSYLKDNKITVTIEIVPKKSYGNSNKTSDTDAKSPNYVNISETGDSVLEILRQFAIRLDHPVIGHHLKVIVISKQLLKEQRIQSLMDFVLRDNDIRPSSLILMSEGRAADTLKTKYGDEIPAFHIRGMTRNRFRTNRIMKGIVISELDALMHSKKSFVLQNIVEANQEVEFSGGGVIKGDTGKWVGNLDQEDTESIAWIMGDVKGGTLKTYDPDHQTVTYEIKSAKSKISAKVNKDHEPEFHVSIESEGRLIEKWKNPGQSSKKEYLEKMQGIFEERLSAMIQSLMQKMQSEYKVEVAGFGERLSVEEPQEWKKLKDHWDETFSRTPVTFDIKLTITDFGSFIE
ncbi:Ger(x)C family spore germination protein [Paenibacillus graminis]|uniref:Spore gernimation protein GerC n=1 Tax=Paenibacillus graminis TaxID=189425 RepID=A0A089MBV6_9BACL|nr:Ger(x)C family spore germination protein [Paenibacillus graminis]AIQ68923.1 spore gernimation protein GerC [Paenibacillus graminis]